MQGEGVPWGSLLRSAGGQAGGRWRQHLTVQPILGCPVPSSLPQARCCCLHPPCT